MIQHFTYEKLFKGDLPGWRISFYYKREKIDAIYHKDGTIEVEFPQEFAMTAQLKKDIDQLMLYHVYDA